jgi:hypothetical protein
MGWASGQPAAPPTLPPVACLAHLHCSLVGILEDRGRLLSQEEPPAAVTSRPGMIGHCRSGFSLGLGTLINRLLVVPSRANVSSTGLMSMRSKNTGSCVLGTSKKVPPMTTLYESSNSLRSDK